MCLIVPDMCPYTNMTCSLRVRVYVVEGLGLTHHTAIYVCSNLQHERKIVRDLQQQLDKQHDEMAQELEKGRRQTDALRDANAALTARQAGHDAVHATALTGLEAERFALVQRLEASEEQVTRLEQSLAVSLYRVRTHAVIA